jgi:hypothetical protein
MEVEMRQEATFFDECEPRLVFIAKKLKESLAVELLFCQNGVDYGVEPDRYRGGFVFQTERVGAFFYVRPDAEERTRGLLTQHGYQPTPLEGEAERPCPN